MIQRSLSFLLLACLSIFMAGCERVAESDAPLSAWVTILPQKYLAERIGGEFVQVDVLLRPGQSPELYSPSAAEMGRVSKADLYLGIGVPVEAALLERMESSLSKVTFVSTGRPLDLHAHHDHDHAHDHEDIDEDPHIWVNPLEMISVAQKMRDAFVELYPAGAESFQVNAAALIDDLRQLDADLVAQMKPYAGRSFIINHPSLGHFAERYQLKQLSIEQAGTTPSARRVADLVAEARALRVGAILTQPEFGRSSAAVLARELGVEMIEIDPLAEDYIGNLRKIGETMEQVFRHD